MATLAHVDGAALLWALLGAVGGVIFYGRFYVQWLVSEMQRRSVMPTAFWYMSGVGSLMLFVYAVRAQSPLGALGQAFGIVVYTRNLVHIAREKKQLHPVAHKVIHAGLLAVILVTSVLVLHVWHREYAATRLAPAAHSARVWFWLAVGLAGQALFAGRFLIQWLATEREGKSVVPPVFWHMSLAAALMQSACFAQRREWVFAIGMAATILIYARNIWLLKREAEAYAQG